MCDPQTDLDLVRQLAGGNREALKEFLTDHVELLQPIIDFYARWVWTEREDCSQAAWEELCKCLPKRLETWLRDGCPGHLHGLLRARAFYAAIHVVAQTKKQLIKERSNVPIDASPPGDEELYCNGEVISDGSYERIDECFEIDLIRALQDLAVRNPGHFDVLVSTMEGYSDEEISVQYNITKEAVRQRRHRAIEFLRKKIQVQKARNT